MADQAEFVNADSTGQDVFTSAGKTQQFTYFSAFEFKSADEIRKAQADNIPRIWTKYINELKALQQYYSNDIAKYCEARKNKAIIAGLTHFTILLADIIVITLGRHHEIYHPMIKFTDNIANVYDYETMYDIYDYHLADKLIQPYIDVMTGLGFTTTRTKHLTLPGCYCSVTISW